MPAYLYPDDTDFVVTRTSNQSITGQKVFVASSAGIVPVIVRATTSQTANLLEFHDVNGNVVNFIDAAGKIGGSANDDTNAMIWTS